MNSVVISCMLGFCLVETTEMDTKLIRASLYRKLQELPSLSSLLDANWLDKELDKPVNQRSLIMSWISYEEDVFSESNWAWDWLKDLDSALASLKKCSTSSAWKKIVKKIRSHSDRANFKGTLSELSLCVFLSQLGISYELDVALIHGAKKDVDIQAQLGLNQIVNIEVQWLSPSEKSEKKADIAAQYGIKEFSGFDNDYEMRRIKQKVVDKTTKFTEHDITFVALDYTSSPELGSGGFSRIEEALYGSFNEDSLEIDITIRKYVDAVLCFQLQQRNSLFPVRRNIIENPHSSHRNKDAYIKFGEIWSSEVKSLTGNS